MCGIFGAYSPKKISVLEDVYLGLYALQHRGQESAGIAWSDSGGTIETMKGMGLVHKALNQNTLAGMSSFAAIGHVRYSTAGGSFSANAQPLTATYARGDVAIAHNGNITNANGTRQLLQSRGAIFQSTGDTEVILHLMAHQSHKPPLDALLSSLRRLRGAFSLAVLLGNRLVAARDPWGFRPLVLGRREDTWYVASESCALDIIGAELVRDVRPGEIVIIDNNDLQSITIPHTATRQHLCSFEYVYFARPDSVIDGISVYNARKEMGRLLAGENPVSADLVTGMPDSGTIAAMGYAEGSGIPYEKAVVRNRYVGRTFIQPTQRVREIGVRIKLNPIGEIMRNKEVIIVDDSLVRGTTSKRMVRMIRDAGATKVHLRIASPPVRFPCYYGIDTPTSEELAAARMDLPALGKLVEADSLSYISKDDLMAAIGIDPCRMCTACFTGEYMEEKDYEPEL
ncbi:MAG TPA: amidophosphoribosyltransferase [Synergistaceae bacterium]|nr:amidophosphoribosyltransferase [Synergistaceae bacterium]HPQ36828.1 amidophosphoribosyltransferase [Synergistaceae bacterium]